MIKSVNASLVSVILPAFNAEPYLADAIISVLNQTYSKFELILVDDGSNDNTAAIAAGFSDDRLKIFRNACNQGLVATLNRGIAVAKGDLIVRMDADDISMPKRIERLVEIMSGNPRLGVVSCAYEDFSTTKGSLGVTVLPATDAAIRRDLFCKTHVFCHAGSIIRRAALESVGGYRAEWFPVEDRDLWLRIMTKWLGANSTEVLYRVRIHARSVVATSARRQSELMLLSTLEALKEPSTPDSVAEDVRTASWSRGALYAAFGCAMSTDPQDTAQFMQQSVQWNAKAATMSFKELLQDRIAIHLHYHPGDITGVKQGLGRVMAALPSRLSGMPSTMHELLSGMHEIAAFQAHQSGDARYAQRMAMASLSHSTARWGNRGLIKLAIGMGISRGQTKR